MLALGCFGNWLVNNGFAAPSGVEEAPHFPFL